MSIAYLKIDLNINRNSFNPKKTLLFWRPTMKKILFLALLILIVLCFSKNSDFQSTTDKKEIIYLTLVETNDIVELEKEEYIKGVVLAEMSPGFSLEALKAQAVAARTYTSKKFSFQKHICNNPSHCQAWTDPTGSTYYDKISQAVNETKGEELTYLGEPIEAFFHSSSGGKTENSENVWQSQKPYLVSVESPGEEIMNEFHTSKEVLYKDVAEKINIYKNQKVISTEKLNGKIKILSRTEGNRVKDIKIQDTILSGNEIRSIFELRSTNFNVEMKKQSVVFDVYGYGHGVGMSQWGAEAMARNGSNYKEILSHYYPGTLLKKF